MEVAKRCTHAEVDLHFIRNVCSEIICRCTRNSIKLQAPDVIARVNYGRYRCTPALLNHHFGEGGGGRFAIEGINKTWRSRDDNCLFDSIAYLRRPTALRFSNIYRLRYNDTVPIRCVYLPRNSCNSTINLWHELKCEGQETGNFTDRANAYDEYVFLYYNLYHLLINKYLFIYNKFRFSVFSVIRL